MYKSVQEEDALAEKYSLNRKQYKIIDHFKYKRQEMFLQESRDGTEFCIQYCGNGHYFDTFEEAQKWAFKRTKGTHKFVPIIEE